MTLQLAHLCKLFPPSLSHLKQATVSRCSALHRAGWCHALLDNLSTAVYFRSAFLREQMALFVSGLGKQGWSSCLSCPRRSTRKRGGEDLCDRREKQRERATARRLNVG